MILFLPLITIISVAGLSLLWEIGGERMISHALGIAYEEEFETAERLRFVITSTTFAALALIAPSWLLRRLFHRLGDAVGQATAARDAAESANRAKSSFVANMSHEIRTPLNGVLGMVQAMERDELSPTQRGRLNVIRRSGAGLLAILNSVLDIAKIEAGKFELEWAKVDVGMVARDTLDAFSATADEKGLTLALHVDPDARGLYLGDATRLGQIMGNLIANAVKFTNRGSVCVDIAWRAETLVIEVSDTGIGIDPEKVAGLFGKFNQGDVSITRTFGGTGLGLTITQELAELMGGGVEARTEIGSGSTFIVTLPLQRVSGGCGDISADEGPAAPCRRLTSARVLVAEDNAINQLVLKTLLNPMGFEPTFVSDGAQAVAAWEGGDWDIILMDIQMPNMDGAAAARTIRARELALARRPTPIIALTANVLDHQTASYRAAGMQSVIEKPIQARHLSETIATWLEAADVAPAEQISAG